MTKAEIAELLTLAAAFDQRTIGESDVEAWHEVLGDICFADARDLLVAHYKARAERVMPAHLRPEWFNAT